MFSYLTLQQLVLNAVERLENFFQYVADFTFSSVWFMENGRNRNFANRGILQPDRLAYADFQSTSVVNIKPSFQLSCGVL